MSEWQNIETAPKDGKPYLGIIKFGEPFIAHWDGEIHCCKYFTELAPHIPTDWMPLPAPPVIPSE